MGSNGSMWNGKLIPGNLKHDTQNAQQMPTLNVEHSCWNSDGMSTSVHVYISLQREIREWV